MAKRWLLLTVVFLCFGMSAYADQMTVFQVAGTFTDGTTFSGNLTVDTTAGTITAADIWYSGDGQSYTIVGPQGAYDVPPTPVAYTAFIEAPGSSSMFGFAIEGSSALDSLVGFTGGSLCSQSSPCYIPAESGNEYSDWNGASRTVLLQSGDVVAATTAVPEPGSLLLLGASLIIFMVFIAIQRGKLRINSGSDTSFPIPEGQ
jgi:hypothetical protein